MAKKLFSKILIIATVMCICAVTMPTEMKALPQTFTFSGNFSMNGLNLWGSYTAVPVGLWGDEYFVIYSGFDMFGNYHIGCGIFKIKRKSATLELVSQAFAISPGDLLQVMASVNAKCDVYELGTGKLLLKDVEVAGSNSYQSIPVKPSNTPYLIQFKVDGNVVYQQTFIFNSTTNLFKGGAND